MKTQSLRRFTSVWRAFQNEGVYRASTLCSQKSSWGISGQASSELHQAKEAGIKGTRVCWLTSWPVL